MKNSNNTIVRDLLLMQEKTAKCNGFVAGMVAQSWVIQMLGDAWDGNIGHMMCWHRNYQLGDYKENSYSDNLDFLNNLLRATGM